MKPSGLLRAGARKACTRGIEHRTQVLSDDELARSTIVFSPHFDDESLGCGGTILRIRSLGAPARIVFLTDGRASHRDWLPEKELIRRRSAEGIEAGRVLGVDETEIDQLGIEETRLAEHVDEAVVRVKEILRAFEPEQVFVPHRLEPPEDHAATFEIVRRALAKPGRAIEIFEYPIWLWLQWPWAPFASSTESSRPRAILRQLRGLVGFLATLSHRASVGDVLTRKREALNQHRSQMERPVDAPDWPVIGEVADGAFLSRFFQPFEFFARSGDLRGSVRHLR